MPRLKDKVPFNELPLWQKINWPQSILLLVTPAIALVGILTTELQLKTFLWSFFYYGNSALGITAGYHRLYSHNSYKANWLYKAYIILSGTAAVQGSILWWCRDHRAHHRFTDSEKDPYNAKYGLLWSHIGWMIFRKDSKTIGRANIDDLKNDPVVRFQHKYYGLLALFMGFVFPTLVAGLLWGDWRGGYFYAAVTRLVLVHHATFCINSLAHYLGDTPFDDKLTPRDYFITAIITMGEGYHNFHHEFPQDYRNAIKFYQYDPTKWFIYTCSLLGLTYDLKIFPENEVRKGEFIMKEKKLNKLRTSINWGVPLHTLPEYTLAEFKRTCATGGHHWILIDDIVHDVSKFMDEHPGGVKYLRSYIGKDATSAFNGSVYNHSNAARNLIASMRVGRLVKDKSPNTDSTFFSSD